MIEREFIKEKMKYLNVKEFIDAHLKKDAGTGSIEIDKTPLGEKISIAALKPGLVIGRAGKTITLLTKALKDKFKLENPQIEVLEVPNPNLSARIIASRIASSLERFGPKRFRPIGYRALQSITDAGAMGAEIHIGGRGLPGVRARTWRFYAGYLKKCGSVADQLIDTSITYANLRSGTIGVQVRIMLPDTPLPDKVNIKKPEIKVEEVEKPIKELEKPAEKEVEVKEAPKQVETTKAAPKKTTTKQPAAKKAPAKTTAVKKTAKKTTKKKEVKK